MRKHIFHISLAFFCLVSVWWAYGQYNQKIEAQGEESWGVYREKLEQEAENKQQLLDQLAEVKNQTLAERVSYLTLKKGKVEISLLGSSMPLDDGISNSYSVWGNLLEDSLNDLEHAEVRVKAGSGCDSPKTEMIGEEELEEVISTQPDILFYELCLPSEGEGRGSLEVFQEHVDWAMKELKKGLPDTQIVIQTSNPFINDEIIKPATGISFAEYNVQMKKFIEENEWNYIDTYTLITEKMAEREIAFKELLAEPVYPNALSQQLWAEVVTENLHVELIDP